MNLTITTNELEIFRSITWEHQRTFRTPLQDLRRFVATALAAPPLTDASVTIEQVVFPPTHLLELLRSNSISTDDLNDKTIIVSGKDQIAALLETSLADWVDFVFMPTPPLFAIYADHDEYTTFYSHTERDLSLIQSALTSAGFIQIAD